MDLLGAALVFTYAFRKLGHGPSARGLLLALALLSVATLVLYSLWILVVSASFWVVKVDNLSYLFGSLFDAGRWPIAIFRGALWFVFTFVFPLALMTSYPAMALLARLEPGTAIAALGGGLTFASVARLVWRRALGFYTSASS
jgi:ABC-2 type transport system permease protein